jgi:amyloid beta precursor protein binding protein 1
VPTTRDEKTQFKAQVWAKRRPRTEGEEENFEEAVEFAVRAYDLPKLDSLSQAVLDDHEAKNVTKNSAPFWVLAAAVNRFIANEGHGFLLPCSNTLPDLVSKTATYLELRNIYKNRAAKDQEAIIAHLRAIQKEVGQAPEVVSDAEADYFIRNIRGIRCVRLRSLAQEYDPASFNKEFVQEQISDAPMVDEDVEKEIPQNVHWYFALRAADLFQQKFNRYPGVGGNPDRDAEQLYELQTELLTTLGLNEVVETKPEVLQEVARWGATEIHNIAAFVGGIAAQASLKVILQQYVPLNNTLLFNGTSGGCQSMEF